MVAERLSIVGLGKLGLCLASCLAGKGFEILGVDMEEKVVSDVNRGTSLYLEPGLDSLMAEHGGKSLRATVHHREAIETTDVTFVLVPTPSNPDGSFSNRFVEAALRSLGEAFRKSRKTYHLFVISSTVMPGSIHRSFIPILEQHSGRKLNCDFGVCYNPESVALGSVVQGFLRPDLVIIGESTPGAGAKLQSVHRQMCENQPMISRMSIINAEIAKICLNVFITLKVSFANSIANLCESIPSTDVDAITKAIGADRRISPYYFQGGLSFGGTCFPRDTRAYLSLANKQGVQAELIQAVERVNTHQDQRLAEIVLRELGGLENKAVGILGLAFTLNTSVITESPAIKLIRELLKYDVRIVAYDPLATESAKAMFGSAIEYVQSAQRCLEEASLCVVTLRSVELKCAVESYVPESPVTLVDCWRLIDAVRLNEKISYIPLGRSTKTA